MSLATRTIQITDRDLALLRGLFESRIMTLAHVAAMYFGGSPEAAKKRVQRLKHAGVISERPRSRAYDPSILFLSRTGLETLQRSGDTAEYADIGSKAMSKRAHVSPFTIRHELDLLTVKSSLVSAVRMTTDYRIAQFSTWPKLFSFSARQHGDDGVIRTVRMRPDAFVRIEEHRASNTPLQHFFFVELDRSTETQQNLRGRASGYLDFYRRGGFAERFGRATEVYRELPFRVLWIFRNAQRLNNAVESFLQHQPPILTMPWLTTFDQVVADSLGPIWIRPGDCQQTAPRSLDLPDHFPIPPTNRGKREATESVTRTSLFLNRA